MVDVVPEVTRTKKRYTQERPGSVSFASYAFVLEYHGQHRIELYITCNNNDYIAF